MSRLSVYYQFSQGEAGFSNPALGLAKRGFALYYSISNCFAFVSGNVRTVKAARIAKMEAVPREKP